MTTRILLVEDRAPVAQSLADMLIDFGCYVRVAHNGSQALKELGARPYDILLTGVQPGQEALALADAVRRSHPATRVVVATGADEKNPLIGGEGALEIAYKARDPLGVLKFLDRGGAPKNHGALLLVDDDLDELEGFRRALVSGGYAVLAASSGEQALEIARGQKVDQAVIDVRMPGMSGWDTYRALKAVNPRMNAVMLSGSDVEDYLKESFRSNDVPLVLKEFDARQMFGLVNAHLAVSRKTSRECLLLVDDDRALRESVADLLRDEGFAVDEAGQGEEAVAMAARRPYDAVILDYHLPDMSGLLVAERMRQTASDAKILVMTGHPDVDSASHAVHLRVHDYLSKPVNPDALLASLNRALHERRLERQVKDLVHDLHRANEELEKFNQLKSKFLFIVAHDIRSPLTAVKGFALFLMEKVRDAAPMAMEGLRFIVEGAEKIHRLVEDLLDLGRMETGKLSIRRERVEMGKLLASLKDQLGSVAGQDRLELACDFSSAPAFFDADPLRLDQIVSNLVGNAVKHGRGGGKVELIVGREEGGLSIAVRDHGAGMTPEVLARVFDPYYQANEAEKGKGLGLGLAIVKELVQGHGGRVWAESEGPGKGSAFFVRLPNLGSEERTPPP